MQSSKEQQGEIRKPFSAINAKKQRETTEWERLEISSDYVKFKNKIKLKKKINKESIPTTTKKRKLEIPREHFMQRWAQ